MFSIEITISKSNIITSMFSIEITTSKTNIITNSIVSSKFYAQVGTF